MKAIFKTLLFLILVISPAAVNSQVILSLIFGDDLNSGKTIFGIHTDYSFNTMRGFSPQKNLSKLNLGLFFTYKLNERWDLMTEAMAKYSRGTAGLQPYSLNDPVIDSIYSTGSVERKIDYVGMSFSPHYHIYKRFFIEAGPQIMLRTKAKDFFTSNPEEGELTLEHKIKDEVTTFEVSVLAGAGYQSGKNGTGISFLARYNWGLTDVMKDETGTQQNRGFYLVANIPVGRGKMKTAEKKSK